MSRIDPTKINLASQPFRRERAANAGLAAICAALVCCLILLTAIIFHARAQAAELRQAIAASRSNLNIVQRQHARFAGVLRRPANADVFSTTVFLNQVIARRALSWTQAFKDLATVLPNDMKLLAIRLPQVGTADANGANRVQLTMDVGAQRPDAVIGFLKRLSASPSFGAPQVVSQAPPGQNDPLYRYRLTVAYAQKF